MRYLAYLVLAILGGALTLFAYLFAPILPLFAVQADGWLFNHSVWGIGPRLPTWMSWLMTPDNSLDGDAGAQERNGRSYWAKVKWLWRNPAYSFALRYLNAPYITYVKGNKLIKDGDNAKAGWCFVNANGLFQFTYVAYIGFGICIMGNFGWNIRELVDDNVPVKKNPYQATFAITPFRFSGFR